MLEEVTDLSRWRVHWVTALAPVRAVGYVLNKVDGRSSAIKQASGADYAQWTGAAPLHEISGISSSAIPSLKSTNSTRRRNSITGRGKRRGYAPENSSP